MANRRPRRTTDAPHPAEAAASKVVDKVADKVVEKIAKQAAKHEHVVTKAAEKIAEKAARHEHLATISSHKADVLDRVAERLSVLDVWTRPEPPSRRPRFTREQIAATAMGIADREGFAAVSMRRLATELDAGTMTLYHYVRTKDELLTLVTDAVMAEVVLPPDQPLSGNWREAVTTIAERTRAALQRHPWILDITDDPPIGPNSVRHFDQSLQAVASLPLALADKFDIVTAVDEYVFGYSLMERNNLQADDSFDEEMIAYVNDLVATGDYPQLAAMAEAHGLAQSWAEISDHLRDPTRFARNLRRLLDGIEADLSTR
jgi:AcrR family transcriptional regulator